MNITTNIREMIGRTPLFALDKTALAKGCVARILAKTEFVNPGGSIKDRAALFMLDGAKAKGKVGKDTVIIEPTSGNTGIGLAMLCAAEGRRLILTMPDTMSEERRRVFAAYGAELVLTPGAEGMSGCVKKAEELAALYSDSYIPSQFDNPANAAAHYITTGPEIWEDTDGRIDIFVATAGTGGTVTGTGRFLREMKPTVEVYAVEPAASPLLTEGVAAPHKIQGIGANFVPAVLDRKLLSGVLTVADEEAYEYCRILSRNEGLLCGISSGAAVAAAVELGRRPENEGKTIVTVLPDTGMRYVSTEGLF